MGGLSQPEWSPCTFLLAKSRILWLNTQAKSSVWGSKERWEQSRQLRLRARERVKGKEGCKDLFASETRSLLRAPTVANPSESFGEACVRVGECRPRHLRHSWPYFMPHGAFEHYSSWGVRNYIKCLTYSEINCHVVISVFVESQMTLTK